MGKKKMSGNDQSSLSKAADELMNLDVASEYLALKRQLEDTQIKLEVQKELASQLRSEMDVIKRLYADERDLGINRVAEIMHLTKALEHFSLN